MILERGEGSEGDKRWGYGSGESMPGRNNLAGRTYGEEIEGAGREGEGIRRC